MTLVVCFGFESGCARCALAWRGRQLSFLVLRVWCLLDLRKIGLVFDFGNFFQLVLDDAFAGTAEYGKGRTEVPAFTYLGSEKWDVSPDYRFVPDFTWLTRFV